MASKETVPKDEAEDALSLPSPAMSDEDIKAMVEVFSKMGVKPKAKSKEEMEKWMSDYVHGLGLLTPHQPELKPTSTSGTDSGISHPAPPASGPGPVVQPPALGLIPASSAPTRKPWLVKFSGQSSEGYNLWRHQLRSLIKEHHSSTDISDAIRSSLHGRAGDIIARLDEDATLDDIVIKMDSIYGEVDEEEDLLFLFYGSKQEADESVSDWGCRLESIIALLKKQGPLPRSENRMLRTMLWKGLRKDLQDLSGYKYDKVESFDELRVVLRRIEKNQLERGNPTSTDRKFSKPTPAKGMQTSGQDEVYALLRKLTDDVASLKATQNNQRVSNDRRNRNESGQTYQDRDFTSKSRNRNNRSFHSSGTFQPESPVFPPQQQRFASRTQQQFTSQPQQQFDRQPQQHFVPQQHPPQHRQQPVHHDNTQEPTCRRCGQRGHIAVGCRVRTDHLRRPQDF